MSVKTLVLPIFRRYWLWHAIRDPTSEIAVQRAVRNWREGENLEAKFQLLGQKITDKVRWAVIYMHTGVR
jgi:hypothetical protein